MDVLIRPVEEDDFLQIIELIKELALFEKVPDSMTNSLEMMFKEKDYIKGFVAEAPHKKIVGYTTYFFGYFTWVGKSLYMDDLYVKSECRTQGIGTRLIEEVIGLAKATDCHMMRWQVSRWNKPAIALYKKLGATIEKTEHNCDLMLG